MRAIAAVDDLAQLLLADDLIDLELEHIVDRFALLPAHILRNRLVEDHAADRGIDDARMLHAVDFLGHADVARRLQCELAGAVSHQRLVHVGKVFARADKTLVNHGQVIAAQNHVLRRADNRLTIGGLQNVVRR